MDWEQYRQDVFRTVRPDLEPEARLISGALGLCGEAGEVAEELKKHFFHGHDLDKARLSSELGDVLWYWVLLCDALELSMDDVVAGNVAKLRRRYPDGFSIGRSVNRLPEGAPGGSEDL